MIKYLYVFEFMNVLYVQVNCFCLIILFKIVFGVDIFQWNFFFNKGRLKVVFVND